MASAGHHDIPPPLLHCVFPPQAAEPCSRTVTGSQCWLLSCIDLGNGFHYSHTRLCNLTHAQTSFVHSLRGHFINPSTANSAFNPAMTCIRHRMRSRRGGTHGGSIRPPATPSPDSVTPASSTEIPNPYIFISGQYPDTRSRGGRARLQGVGRREAAVHTTNFPLPLHPAPHTMQFRFRSTVNRPVITATVTITFSEEIDPSAPPPEHNDDQQKVEPSNRGIRNPGKQQPDEDRTTLHGKAMVGSQQDAGGKLGYMQASGNQWGDTSGTHAGVGSTMGTHPTQGNGMSAGGDDWYKYACQIEEEPTPDNL